MKKLAVWIVSIVMIICNGMTVYAKPIAICDGKVIDPEYVVMQCPEATKYSNDLLAMYDKYFVESYGQEKASFPPFQVSDEINFHVSLPEYGFEDTFSGWGEYKTYHVKSNREEFALALMKATMQEFQRVMAERGFTCSASVDDYILQLNDFIPEFGVYMNFSYDNRIISKEGYTFTRTIYGSYGIDNDEVYIHIPEVYELAVGIFTGIAYYQGMPHADAVKPNCWIRMPYQEFAEEYARGNIGYFAPNTGTGQFSHAVGGYAVIDLCFEQWYMKNGTVAYY